jgi:MFS family permease
MLIAMRALQGAGSAMMFATMNPILITSYPAQERGRVLGITVGAVYAGLSVGPFVGGLLTHLMDWRAIFLFNAVLILAAFFLALRHIEKDKPLSHGEPFDWTGSMLNGLFLGGLIFAMARVPHPDCIVLFIVGSASGVLFVLHQTRSAHPILRISLFRGNPVFFKSNLAAMINYSATFAIAFLLSLYFQYVCGFTPQHAGLVLLCQPVAQALLSPAMGRLSDRVEPWILSSLGMALITAVLFLFVFIGSATPLWLIVCGLFLLGIGFALFSSPNTNAVMSAVSHRDLGMASALLSNMRVLGQVLSMGIAMLVFSLVIGRVKIDSSSAAVFLSAMKICFGVFTLICAAGVYFSMSRGSVHKKKETLPVIPPGD